MTWSRPRAGARDDLGRGAHDRGHLGRVVRVVVDDGDAVDLAPHLEAASGAEKAGQTGEDGVGVGTEPDDGGEVGGARVEDVVRPRHLEAEQPLGAVADQDRVEPSPSGTGRDAHVGAVLEAVVTSAAPGECGIGQGQCTGVVVAGDEEAAGLGDRVGEALVGGDDLVGGAVEVEVVGLDVGDDRDVRPVGEEGAVALVGLDDDAFSPPSAAFVPSWAISAPAAYEGSAPAASSPTTSIAVVVVLPFAPATATRRPSAMREARAWARWRTGSPAARAAASSTLSSRIAEEMTTVSTSATRAGS